MSSLKNHFGKACKRFLAQNPGRVITEADLAGLVGQAWPLALTPSNLISGFCKCGIYPLNPGRITDRHMAHSTVYNGEKEHSWSLNSPSNTNNNASGQSPQSSASVQSSSLLSIQSSPLNARSSSLPVCSSSESKSIDDILLLPKAKMTSKQTRVGLTSNAQYVTASPFLNILHERKAMRDERERKKGITKIKSKPKQSKPKSKSKSKSKSKLKSKPNRKQTVAARSSSSSTRQ